MQMRTVFISDTTLRDGEQAPGVSFDAAEKCAIAAMLDQVGVHEIECGMPAVGREEQNAAERIMSLGLTARIVGWNRAIIRDVEASVECGLQAVAISVPVSDIQIHRKLGKTQRWVLRQLELCVDFAKQRGLYVCVGAEDASRADDRFLIELAKRAKELHADRLRFSDTVGCLEPFAFKDRIRRLSNHTDLPLEIHCHNDLGLATANALAGVRGGATWVSATVLGIGERAGNTALEEIVMALKYACEIDVPLRASALPELCRYVAEAARRLIWPGKPIVGEAIFRHEAGIHADGVIKDPRTYEQFRPEDLGFAREIVLGKHSGRAAVRHRLNRLGVVTDAQTVDRILSDVRAAGVRLKRTVTDKELLDLFRHGQDECRAPSSLHFTIE